MDASCRPGRNGVAVDIDQFVIWCIELTRGSSFDRFRVSTCFQYSDSCSTRVPWRDDAEDEIRPHNEFGVSVVCSYTKLLYSFERIFATMVRLRLMFCGFAYLLPAVQVATL
jgi:hypothetical protein